MPVPRCSTHRSAVAGWACSSCAKDLCVACAATSEHRVVVCATCGTVADRHFAARAEQFPYASAWPAALAELKSPRGVFQILVFAVAVNTLVTYGRSLWVAGWALAAAWTLNLARRRSLGFDAFALPLWEDLRLVLVGSLPRLAVIAAPIGVGAAAWTQLGLRAPSSLWGWPLAAAAVLLLPGAAVRATVEGAGAGRLFSGPSTGGLGPARWAMALAAAAELVCAALPPVNRALEDTRMLEHLAIAFVPRLVTFVALAAFGVLAGTLVHTHAGLLEHRDPADDRVPRVTEAPTGRWAPKRPDPAEVAEKEARRFAPIALDETPGLTAIAAGDRPGAVALFRTGALRAAGHDPDQAVTLAQWLAAEGDVAAAAGVLEVAVARPGESAALARAMVVLARICDERLGDAVKARRFYEDVARRFPGSPAAKFAAERLALKA